MTDRRRFDPRNQEPLDKDETSAHDRAVQPMSRAELELGEPILREDEVNNQR